MYLAVRDVAGLLGVSEKMVYRWVSTSKLPTHRVGDQYRFNREEILEWATSQGIPLSPRIVEDPDDDRVPLLENAIRAGGIHYGVGGRDKASVLKNAIESMPLPEEVDRGHLLQVLLARESIGSTGIGHGIAIPHVRNPVVFHVTQPIMAISFLEDSIEFHAVDGKPVHTLITMICPTIKAHLSLLNRLVYGLKNSAFSLAVHRRDPLDAILNAARDLDRMLSLKPPGGDGNGKP